MTFDNNTRSNQLSTVLCVMVMMCNGVRSLGPGPVGLGLPLQLHGAATNQLSVPEPGG